MNPILEKGTAVLFLLGILLWFFLCVFLGAFLVKVIPVPDSIRGAVGAVIMVIAIIVAVWSSERLAKPIIRKLGG